MLAGRNLLIVALLYFSSAMAGHSVANRPGARLAYERIAGLGFEANLGQFDREVRYVLSFGDTALLLTREGASVVFRGASRQKREIRMKFAGASPDVCVEGEEKLTAVSNYLVGKDPARWITGAPHYARVRYRGVYPGADVVFHGVGKHLEYDWVVAPGADPERIRLAFEGAEAVEVDPGGDLVVRSGSFELRHRRAIAYQDVQSVRKPVEARYRVTGSHEAGFELGAYNRGEVLTIDPVLEYSTVFGGSGSDTHFGHEFDSVRGVAVDRLGNTYVVGRSASLDFSPATYILGEDATGGFVAKLNPKGSLVYVTILNLAQVEAVTVDSEGSTYIVSSGLLGSVPVTTTFLSPQATGGVFIGKLNPSGSAFLYSVLVGGDRGGTGEDIAVDTEGNAYVTGLTESSDFPVTPGAIQPRLGGEGIDAFALKLRRDGRALLYSTYLGGSRSDWGESIAVDGAGHIFVAGSTNSTDFPVTPGAFQKACVPLGGLAGCSSGFVAKLNPRGSALVYSTFFDGLYFGGAAVDAGGNAYVTGHTIRTDFPTTPGAFQTTARQSSHWPIKAVALKLSPDGSRLVYSTYLGGSETEFGWDIAVDAAGNAYVTGQTNSPDFPLVRPLQAAYVAEQCFYDPPLAPCFDAFLAKLNPEGSGLIYSTYFGGSRDERVRSIAVNGPDVFLAGASGSTDLPATSRTPKGGLMVVKISEWADEPVFTAASTTNAASYASGLTPGGIATVFGTGLSVANGVLWAPSLPLPRSLAGTTVFVNGMQAPLLAIANVDGREQINFVAPWEIGGEAVATVQVINNGLASLPVRVPVLPVQPGVFLIDGVHAAALHGADYSLVWAERPARRGEVILLYATGLGAVQPLVADGAPAPVDPLSRTVTMPEVLIDGIPAEVQFSGLAPGYAGLYQLNVVVPAGIASGDVEVVVTVAGQASPAAKLVVE
jgi:uncharacterized protein (TIGR03437 family)